MAEMEELSKSEYKTKGKKKNESAKKKKTPKNTKKTTTLENRNGVTGNKKVKAKKVPGNKKVKTKKVLGNKKVKAIKVQGNKVKTKKVKKVLKQKTVIVDKETEKNEDNEKENVLKPTNTPEKPSVNKHVVFDDDDDAFKNLPDLSSFATTETHDMKEEESDSDAPPEEETISTGRDIFAEEDKKLKSELIKLKNQVREARRLKHEKNKEQQKKKRERLQKLEESRLSEDLLSAVAMEEDEPKNATAPKKKKKKRKYVAENIADESLITLERGVKVQAIEQQVKKFKSIANIAADFRKNALYNKQIQRMSGRDQRMMDVKQKKSGKN